MMMMMMITLSVVFPFYDSEVHLSFHAGSIIWDTRCIDATFRELIRLQWILVALFRFSFVMLGFCDSPPPPPPHNNSSASDALMPSFQFINPPFPMWNSSGLPFPVSMVTISRAKVQYKDRFSRYIYYPFESAETNVSTSLGECNLIFSPWRIFFVSRAVRCVYTEASLGLYTRSGRGVRNSYILSIFSTFILKLFPTATLLINLRPKAITSSGHRYGPCLVWRKKDRDDAGNGLGVLFGLESALVELT